MAMAVATLNIAFSAGLDVRTFIGRLSPSYESAFAVPFILIFPLAWWAATLMVALAGGTRRGTVSDLPRRADTIGRIPPLILQILGALAAFAVVCAATGIPSITSGQPHFDPAGGGQYTLNNHGSVTVVARAVYEQAVAGQIRFFLCGVILASSFGLCVALNHWLVRRASKP